MDNTQFPECWFTKLQPFCIQVISSAFIQSPGSSTQLSFRSLQPHFRSESMCKPSSGPVGLMKLVIIYPLSFSRVIYVDFFRKNIYCLQVFRRLCSARILELGHPLQTLFIFPQSQLRQPQRHDQRDGGWSAGLCCVFFVCHYIFGFVFSTRIIRARKLPKFPSHSKLPFRCHI